MSGNVTSCQIVILTNSAKELQDDVLTPAPTMLTQVVLPVVRVRTVWPPDTKLFAPVPRPTLVIPSYHVDHSPRQISATPILVESTHSVNQAKTLEQERTDQCVSAMKGSEVKFESRM